MEKMQESEWLEAQDIVISKDLAPVAKQQLDFLAAVDRRRFLYDGPLLEKAIYRYKTYWLPLLAKHTESAIIEGSLVVPLDCEWIWHCHRLNPVQYKKDCEKFYGRILDNENVESSIHATSYTESAEIWAEYYKVEPFELEYNCISTYSSAQMNSETGETITYDLISAVKRQSTFYYQVARPSMHDPRFLKEAEARYKGFLHLIKRNKEKSINLFCVPTYDLDLMWHSHQLQPMAYCKDMLQLFGKVLEHDDTDSDRSKGKKLDTGFYETTKQWEDTYGFRYWRAGAMYKGSMPSPLDVPLDVSRMYSESMPIMDKSSLLPLPLQKTTATEVLLEIVGIRNFSPGQKGNLFVAVSKKQTDIFFSGSCTLTIASETGEKQAISFQCEPKGDLELELMIKSLNSVKSVGTTTVPFQNLTDQNSKLYFEKWVELKLHSKNVESKPVSLHIAASFTVPFETPHVIEMLSPSSGFMNACLFPRRTKDQKIRRWARFVDVDGSDIISLQMRNAKEKKGTNKGVIKKNVVGITQLSRNPIIFAEYVENTWSIKDYDLSLTIEKINAEVDLEFQLLGGNQTKFFPGKKLEFQPKNCNHDDLDCITAVEFSSDHPYGKAVALLNTESSLIEVNEEWHVLPAILLMFIFKSEGLSGKNMKSVTSLDSKAVESLKVIEVKPASNVKGGGCGGGCGSGCSNVLGAGELIKATKGAGGCGSGCGGGCGSMLVEGSGGGCGGGCGSMVASGNGGGCGSGCGGGCGSMLVKGSGSGCGGGCGGGCGSMVASGNGGGCGGGCGSGCGNMVAGRNGGGRGNVIIQASA